MAEKTIADGMLKFPWLLSALITTQQEQFRTAKFHSHLGRCAREVEYRRPVGFFNRDLQDDLCSIVEPIYRFERLPAELLVDVPEQITHRSLGGGHDSVHVEIDEFERLLIDQSVDEHYTSVTRCDLGVEVGQVLMFSSLIGAECDRSFGDGAHIRQSPRSRTARVLGGFLG